MRLCNICGWQGERFNILFNERLRIKQETVCPVCSSLARQRVLYKYLINRFSRETILNCLEVAPHGCNLVQKALPMAHYVSIDIDDSKVMQQGDLTNLDNDSESVDLIVCSHVLEHIKNDFVAIFEMHRVLRKGGIAIVQVPFGFKQGFKLDKGLKTVEFSAPRYYGHWRSYGLDICYKLCRVGFLLSVMEYNDSGICNDSTETLFACAKQ